ncbi:MAG: hypothetical protein H0T91_07510, partial [Propionibacteriaceae bacterium]|nr:hypothetical protein [Propionibacteriaceae bacterium]
MSPGAPRPSERRDRENTCTGPRSGAAQRIRRAAQRIRRAAQPWRKGGRVVRFLRGLAALLALVVGLAGIPTALILLAGNPVPAELSWTWATDALFTPDDGTVLVGLIGLIGWISWLLFAISVVAESIT